MPRGIIRLLLVLAVGLGAAPIRAQDSLPRAEVGRTTLTIEVDGVLDDDAWADAPLLGPLRQKEPIENGEPSERTEVRLVHDGETLYIGVRAYDREPEKLVAKQMRRDGSLQSDDRVSVMIGPFGDRRNGFFFSTNPNAARLDGISEDNQVLRNEWDGIWFAASAIDAEGWTTEIAIPFKTLPFDPRASHWDFQLLRSVRRRNELLQWASPLQNANFIDLSRAGRLTGITGIDQGLGLDVVPGAKVNYADRKIRGTRGAEVEPSLDVFKRLSPSVTAALTLNPDFTDAPVDARQVNLSRFALFFPETRDFFLQDAGIFDFGDLRERNGMPFFSRRVGLGERGQVVDIHAGAKVTGRVGPVNFGVLSAQQEAYDGIRSKNLSVARAKWNVLEESYVGFIATHGDPLSNGSNTLGGADFLYRTTRALGDQTFEVFGWGQKSHTPGLSGESHAYGGRIAWPNDRWNGRVVYTEIADAFDPALGFVNRSDIRQYEGDLRRRFRPSDSFIRTVDVFLGGRVVTDRGNHLESIQVDGTAFTITNQDGDFVSLRGQGRTEVLSAPFRVYPGIVLPADRYGFGTGLIEVGTANSRPVAVTASWSMGTFFSGTIRTVATTVELRPSRMLFASIQFEQNQVDLPEGAFTTRIARVDVNFAFTPDLSWDNRIQWDDLTDSLGWNSRLRWIVVPGSELSLVFNQGMDTSDGNFQRLSTDVTAKVAWTFRF